MPARLRLSWGMKSLKLFLLPALASLGFGWQVIRYALIFVSAFFRQRASLGCEILAIRSQLTFYEESIRQKRQPHPRFLGGQFKSGQLGSDQNRPTEVARNC